VSRLRLATGITLILLLIGRANSQSKCFAYLQDGDIFTSCGGTRLQLTKSGNISDFSIGADGTYAAFERQHIVRKSNVTNLMDCEISVYHLGSTEPPRIVTHACGHLESSCGTILLEQRGTGVRDLIARTALYIEGYKRFLCSKDRSVVAGWPGDSNYNLSTGTPDPKKLAQVAGGCSVSSSGRIAYFTDSSDTNSVCEVDRGGKLSCLTNADAFDRIGVNDSGEVLFTTHSDGGCFYHGNKVIKAHPPQVGNDQCLGIGMWTSGSNKSLMVDLARAPQWLTPAAADVVKRCVASSKGCFRE
jgi:hypothetical protein